MGGHSQPRPKSADRHPRSAGRGATARVPSVSTAGTVSDRTAISCPGTPKVNRTRRTCHRNPHPAVTSRLRDSRPPPDHDSDERAAGETGVVEWDIPCTARVRDSSTPVKARTTDRRVPGSAFGPDAPEAVGPAVPDLAFEDSLRGVFGPPSPRRCSVGSEGAQPPASLRRALTECGPKGYAGLATKRASDEPVDRSANAPVQRAGLASSTRSRNLSISRISARRPT